MRVLKFGGKSLATAEQTKQICKFIKKIYKDKKELVIVVSAMGNTTNELIKNAKLYGNTHKNAREMAKLLTTGEIESSALVAIMLCSMGVPAISYTAKDIGLKTFGGYSEAKIKSININKIKKQTSQGKVVVVAGFQGVNYAGEFTTLGRGGSDTTATAIASILGANVEIYSDFNGIFCGDPALSHFKKLKSISYDMVISMAEAGAKVIEKRSAKIAKKFNIKIISKASSKPNLSGTIISNIEDENETICITQNLSKITIIVPSEFKKIKILKSVLTILKDFTYQNFSVGSNKIEFFVNCVDEINVCKLISKKLNLLKNH